MSPSYRTLLVHLNNAHRTGRLIEVALQIARPASAHVIGLYVVPHVPVTSPIFPEVSNAIIQSGLEVHRTRGVEIHGQVERAFAGLPMVVEWRQIEPRHQGYTATVLHQARSADLVIVPQKETDFDYGDMFDIPDELAIGSGRPVLIVPREGAIGTLGRRILVAWNNSREAARAVFDALPLLVAAAEVRIATVEEADKPQTRGGTAGGAAGSMAGSDIAATLARHGVTCVVDHLSPAGRDDPGKALLDHVATHQCDMLVMGCYGKSRLRELILGGASRHVLRTATVPVLMAH